MDVNIGPEACSHCCSCIWRATFAASGEWWVVRCAQSQLLSQVFHHGGRDDDGGGDDGDDGVELCIVHNPCRVHRQSFFCRELEFLLRS